MIAEIYNSIRDYINSNLGDSIKTVQPWNNQLQRNTREKGVLYPALYIDFPTIVYTDYPGGWQTANIACRLYLVTRNLENNTDMFSLAEQLHVHLQQFCPSYCGPMLRESMQTDIDHDSLYLLKIDYRLDAVDTNDLSGTIDKSGVVLGLNVDLDIDNDVVRSGDGVE